MEGSLKGSLWNAETWFQPPEGVNLMFQDKYKIRKSTEKRRTNKYRYLIQIYVDTKHNKNKV